uniref:Lipoprotein n=1 Tax=Desulfovibrio sp. U5L TaxID=596152 RepID=I2PXK7_9BACT
MARVCMAALLVFLLAGCAGNIANKAALGTEPTVYAKVLKEPDPLLLGCYLRSRPSEFNRPNSYQYCLVKKGDRYAVYYKWRDGKTMEQHEGWMPFTINGDRMISDTEPSTYLVKDGGVWHNYGGRSMLSRMVRE